MGTATNDVYALSLHDALPISASVGLSTWVPKFSMSRVSSSSVIGMRSEEHTSELQSRENLVCRLLLEKKKDVSHYLQPNTQLDVDAKTREHSTYMVGLGSPVV